MRRAGPLQSRRVRETSREVFSRAPSSLAMGWWQRLAWLLSATLAATGQGHTPWLIRAIQAYHAKKLSKELVLRALADTSDIDEQDEHGITALMLAAAVGDKEVLEGILEAKADVNIQAHDGETALMGAARLSKRPQAVQAILHAKADVNLQENNGLTALMMASQYRGPEAVQDILAAKPDVNIRNKFGMTALILAAHFNQPEAVGAILLAKPDVNLQSNEQDWGQGWTAVMEAARYNQLEAVQAILKHKPDLDLQTGDDGTTALILAVQNKFGPDTAAAMTKALLRAGADPDMATYDGRTPLMWAAFLGRLEAVKVLLDGGSRAELRSRSGLNALDFAKRGKKEHMYIAGIKHRNFKQLLKSLKDVLKLIKLLEKKTPAGMELARIYFSSATTWSFLGCGLAAGIASGGFLVALTKRSRSPTDSNEVTVRVSSRRLPIKSLTKNIWLAEAFRMLELVACVLLPLFGTLLWIAPWKFLLFYFAVYILPALMWWQSRVFRVPALLLASPGTRPGLLCPVRLPRAISTLAQLAFLIVAPGNCRNAIKYYTYGHAPLIVNVTQPLLSVTQWKLLSRASSEMACPAMNTFEEKAKNVFFGAQYFVQCVSLIWVVLVTLDTCCSFMKAAQGEDQAVEELSERISKTEAKHEIQEIKDPVAVTPESAIQCMPPGGIYFTVAMTVLDVLLDFYSIYCCIMAAQLKFATMMVVIVATSSCVEVLTVDLGNLMQQISISVKRGLSTDALLRALEFESSFEAPLSLCLTAYTLAFNVRGGWAFATLCISLLSLSVSVYNTASFLCRTVDFELYTDEEDDSKYRRVIAMEEPSAKAQA